MCYNAFNTDIFRQQGTEKLRKSCLLQAPNITKGTTLEVCPPNLCLQWALDLNTLTPLFKYGESGVFMTEMLEISLSL